LRGLPIEPWKTIHQTEPESFRIFTIRRETAVSPRSGVSHQFVVLYAPEWINVIPITPEGEVVFVRQYRQGTRSVTLEVPGGMAHAGESPEAAGERELLEETGYRGERALRIGQVHPNPAIQTNACYTVLVEGARRVAEPTPDPAEEIETELVPLDRVGALIREGAIAHALVVAAFHHLALHRSGNRA
jgi:8-oxo-dGTP pyrophosphatase MutT (NUDIX family)